MTIIANISWSTVGRSSRLIASASSIVLTLSLAFFAMSLETARAQERSETTPHQVQAEPTLPTRYLTIPIHGNIGSKDLVEYGVVAPALQAALDFAVDRRIPYVVLDIDTNGGIVDEAQALANVIDRARSRARAPLTLIAFIHRSFSAGMWLVLKCDEVVLSSEGAQGAALAYRTTATRGNQVDAKFNASVASELRSLAASSSLDPDIIEAMVLPDRVVYAVRTSPDENAREHLIVRGEREEIPPGRLLFDENTVVALSHQDALRYGFVKHSASSIEAIGEVLGIPRWTSFGNHGEAQMQRAWQRLADAERDRRRQIHELAERIKYVDRVIAALPVQVSEAHRAHPSNFRYTTYVSSRTGGEYYTEQAKREWASRTDHAIRLWSAVGDTAGRIPGSMRDLHALGRRLERVDPFWTLKESHEASLKDLRKVLETLQGRTGTVRPIHTLANSTIRELRSNRTLH